MYSEIMVQGEKKDGAVLWSQKVAVNDAHPGMETAWTAILKAVAQTVSGYFTGNPDLEASAVAKAKESGHSVMSGSDYSYMAKDTIGIGEDADFDLIRVMFHAGSKDKLKPETCKTIFAPPESQKISEELKPEEKIYEIHYVLYKNTLHKATYPFIFGAQDNGLHNDVAVTSKVDISLISSPAFFSKWTHIVGAPNGLMLFYDAHSGYGVLKRLDIEGTFTILREYKDFARGWTHIIPVSGGLMMFYNATTGQVAIGTLNADGSFTILHQYIDFAHGWTYIIPARTGLLLFYNSYKGSAATGRLEVDGTCRILRGFSFFNLKWIHVAPTSIASANNGIIIFYDNNQGRATTGKVNTDGTFKFLRRSDDFCTNCTHIVPASNDLMLYYNANAGRGTVVRVDVDGTCTTLSESTDIARGWTHIVPASNGLIYYYNANEGRSAIGRVDVDGACITLREF
jgi:hypothetical protein